MLEKIFLAAKLGILAAAFAVVVTVAVFMMLMRRK